jgi:signal transduction histidine kinase/class 3 adenylate cyclase
MRSLETRHEDLHEAYVELQQTAADLQRGVDHLTTLHDAGLVFASILDREALIETVLHTVTKQLHYDRAMLKFFDPDRQVTYDARIVGVPSEVAAFARQIEVPVTDKDSLEGKVFLQGEPILIDDVQQVLDQLHPLYQQLAMMTQAKSIISVPLKVQNKVLGSLTVDRTREHSLTRDDLNVMATLASQVAVSLDNALTYQQIEQLTQTLEQRVQDRTQELQDANSRLQELDRLKSEFFANVSHEFRTPLTLSLGALNTLLKMSPTAKAKEQVHAGLRNTSRLLFLINELLELAKCDSGLAVLKKRCIDLAVLVRDVAANFESGERPRIHFRGTHEPVPVEADPQQIKKVLYNLLANAFKFSDPDRGQVWIRLGSKGDGIELEVGDNGIGIPRDQLDRIFDRFTQVEGSATRRYEGTGIGLALVKEIVASHGGMIRVESELGRGSTFTVWLPRGVASADSIVAVENEDSPMLSVLGVNHPERASSAASSPAAGGHRPLLLVADDNADMRWYLERLFSSQYRVVLAKDGVEGLEQAKACRPDLIITDVMMPRMSGHDLLKAVRKDDALRSTPVIFLTARAGTEAQVECLEAGADDYVAKPFDENEILARVNNLICLRAQERELMELQKEKLTRYLPAQLAEVILSDRDEVLRSHRAEITVAFIDLRDFTAFSETAAPEDVLGILQEYQSEMGRLIADHHGMIERFSGDAIMIFFNDPFPIPNHAEQAVRLAIAMRDRIGQLKQKWSERGIELGAGIGIATGFATLGLIGFEKRKDYAAIGAVTNLAARLCVEARHGQILISGPVLHLVKDLVHTESVGNLTLKGFHKSVPAYNVTGLAEQRPPRDREKTKKSRGE